jgi:hypothetical protein
MADGMVVDSVLVEALRREVEQATSAMGDRAEEEQALLGLRDAAAAVLAGARSLCWVPISEHLRERLPPEKAVVVLANRYGVLGRFSSTRVDEGGERLWWIDDCYYDGDEPPTHWIELPAIPR